MTKDPSKYFEGKPCPHGHTERYISTGDCVICACERNRLAKAKKRCNKEKKPHETPPPLIDFQHRVTVLGNINRNL
ncbi:hypothetical protein Xszus_02122 [Xenorhabdus szentirmaii]|nr:hypothetical protein Xszus_02122 [Xenorhabdus szentirmaii]